jgi:hypothetical protein
METLGMETLEMETLEMETLGTTYSRPVYGGNDE